MKTSRPNAILAFALIFIVISCKRETTSTTSGTGHEISTSNQLSLTDAQVIEGIATAMDAADGTEDGSADLRPLGCVLVSAETGLKKITIDFGGGCINPLTGLSRSGKIIVSYTGNSYTQAGSRSIEFVNYKTVDTVTLNGIFSQTNILRTDSTVAFTLSASNFTFLYADGLTHTLVTYTRHFDINLGARLRDLSDNTTTITGNTLGVNKEGEPYSVNITAPVIISGVCALEGIFYPSTGSYDVKIGSRPKFNLSWGNGACDKIITVNYQGFSVDIPLK